MSQQTAAFSSLTACRLFNSLIQWTWKKQESVSCQREHINSQTRSDSIPVQLTDNKFSRFAVNGDQRN
jgi:hypothetical protein